MSNIQPGMQVTYSHYGEQRRGEISHVANGLVWLVDGRWLHESSVQAPCYGVYRVLRNGTLRYLPRSATHSKALAESIAADRSRGEIVTPTGRIARTKAWPHVAREI